MAADHIYRRRLTFNVLPSKAHYSTIHVWSQHDFIYALSIKLSQTHHFTPPLHRNRKQLHREIMYLSPGFLETCDKKGSLITCCVKNFALGIIYKADIQTHF